MITKVTGKNQVTIPAEIAAKMSLHKGSRFEWKLTDKKNVLEVRVLPDMSSIAESLKGKGKALKKRGSAVGRLITEREQESR